MLDPNLGKWTYQYNAFGKLISQTDAKGQTLTISYDILGRKTKRNEPEDTTTWEYDIGNQAIGKLSNVTTATTSKNYTYDNLGRLSRVTTNLDEVSLTTSISYDNYSRIATKNYPNNYQLIYTYNHHGYLESVKTPQGLQVDGYNLAHLAAVKQQAIATADRLLNQSIDWINRASEYRAIAQQQIAIAQEYTALSNQYQQLPEDYQHKAQQLLNHAQDLEQLAIDNLELAEQYLYWAENPQLASQLHEQVALYNNNLTDTANIIYWQAREYDAMGRSTSFVFGNGLVTNNLYNSAGQLTQINTGFGYNTPIRDLAYEYDLDNNITSRNDKILDIQENFVYDSLNRLLSTTTNLGDSQDISFDASGNILNNTGAEYTYHQDKPYAVATAKGNNYSYDAVGNAINKNDTAIGWTSFNKPSKFITASGATTQFVYDSSRKRYKKIEGDGTTTLYLGKGYERITAANGAVTHKYFIYAGSKLIAIHIATANNSTHQVRYLHRDNLGSVDTITGGTGQIVSRQRFSVFGARAETNWQPSASPSILDTSSLFTNRGFTGHEHIDELGLIHMNGRVYDPEIGRFLSADPFVQAPHMSQSYNRYSYVMNNPLRYTDPSGYNWLKEKWDNLREDLKDAGRKFDEKVLQPSKYRLTALIEVGGGAALIYAEYKVGCGGFCASAGYSLINDGIARWQNNDGTGAGSAYIGGEYRIGSDLQSETRPINYPYKPDSSNNQQNIIINDDEIYAKNRQEYLYAKQDEYKSQFISHLRDTSVSVDTLYEYYTQWKKITNHWDTVEQHWRSMGDHARILAVSAVGLGATAYYTHAGSRAFMDSAVDLLEDVQEFVDPIQTHVDSLVNWQEFLNATR